MKRKLLTTHTTLVGTVFICLFLAFTHQMGLSQSSNNQIKDVVMPSPATTAFAKYVDIPVSYHTGVPNISIPICNVTDGSLDLPISLSYHASGIRMAEVSSWVGLGWNLNSVGQVTRTVNGYPDEKNRGYLRDASGGRTPMYIAGGYSEPITGNPSTLSPIMEGIKGTDYEPDMFSFSAGNYSGKFYIHPTEGVVLIPKQDITIKYDNPLDGEFDYFTVITPDGDNYHFGKVAINGAIIGTAEGQYEYANLPSNQEGGTTGNPATVTQTRQTWYLVKIEDHNRINSIDITYEKEFFNYSNRIPSSEISGGVNGVGAFYSPQYNANMALGQNSLRVKKITNSSGTIDVTFNANTVREDVTDGATTALSPKRLDEIVVKLGNTNDYTKKFTFSYDYLLDGSCTQSYCKRLRLTQFQEISYDNTISIPPHIFEYEGDNTYPNRFSKAIDHWGFYNGVTANNNITTLNIPSRGANREPNETYAKKGILKKITYPTGGTVEFLFESNSYQKRSFSSTLTTPQLCGGLRIKKITANDGTQTKETNYDYSGDNNEVSSGLLVMQPVYEFTQDATRPNVTTGATAHLDLKTESSIQPLSDYNGYHIYYDKVSEIRSGIGKTVYKYESESYSSYNLSCYLTAYNTYPFRGSPIFMDVDKLKSVTNIASNGYTASTITNDNRLTSIGYTGNDLPAFRASNFSGSVGGTLFYAHFVTSLYLPKHFDYGRLKSKTELLDGIETKTDFTYSDLHNNPIEIKTTNSTGKIHKTKIFYPLDNPNAVSSNVFIARNITAIPLYSENYVDNTPIGGSQVFIGGSQVAYDFSTYSHFLPTTAYSYTKDHQSKLETLIEEFNDKGLPKRQRTIDYWHAVYYEWDALQRLTSKTLGRTGVTNRLSNYFEYIGNTPLANKITDENGLIKTFAYDKLGRLQTLKDRVQSDGVSDPQGTTTYTYHYKGQTTTVSADINQNFLQTYTTYKDITTPLSTKQYLDGLGRPIEVVKELYTPTSVAHPNDFWHQKNAVAYDVLGRQNKTYLPFESNTLGFETPSTSATVHPYVLTEYEASPLSRPIKQTNVDGSTVQTSYGANVANEVRNITNIASSNTAFYTANSLSKTTMTDENGKQTCVFKDKLGRVVLTRKFLSSQNVDTYNIYDDYGQLVAVLPPGSVDGSGNVTQSLIFKYTYDNKNRLIEKKVPGAEAQKFYYNGIDQLVLTQDGNMAHESPVKYLATIYDDLGRVKKTGFSTSVSPTQGQDITVTESQISELLTQTNYYPNKSWVRDQGAKVLKPTNITTNRNFVWSYIERREGYTYTGNPIWTGKQHLLTPNQPERPILDDDVAGVDWSVSGYDGAQKPTLTVRYLFTGGAANEVRTYQTFNYDNGQRLTDQKYMYALNGAGVSVPTFTLSNMNYNFKDQLIEKNIGLTGSTALQSIDYSYNLRGWLTYINGLNVYGNNNPIYTPSSIGASPIQNLMISPLVRQAISDLTAPYKSAQALEMPPINDTNPDLFSEKIDYNSPDSRTGATGQFNGNISAVAWQVAGRDKQTYGFKYDDLDRLTEANYFDLTDVNTGGQWNSTYSTDNKFQEKQTYDLRGNITSLQRNGYKLGAWTANGYTAANYGLIDSLSYEYNNQNQVIRINDAAVNPNGLHGDKDLKGFVYDFNVGADYSNDNYTYDYNGNLKTDKHKEITNIQYNYLNLPQVITFSGNRTITFVYDAMGTKLQKIVKNNTATPEVYNYVNDVEYKDNVLQRIAHTEGAVTRQVYAPTGAVSYNHEYVLRDHLGNARVTFTDGVSRGDAYWDWNTWTYIDPNVGNTGYNDGVITQDDITQINHYYPFGLNMEGNWNGSFADVKNKYQYNSKELNVDFGLNWNDYGARFYDPAMARWSVIDPLAEKMRRHSPYNYGFDNPIRFIDPDGNAPDEVNDEGPGDGKKGRARRAMRERDKETRRMNRWLRKKGLPRGAGEEYITNKKSGEKPHNEKSEAFGEDAKRTSSATGFKYDGNISNHSGTETPIGTTTIPTGKIEDNTVIPLYEPFAGGNANVLNPRQLDSDISKLAKALNSPENQDLSITIVGTVSGNTNINPATGRNFARDRAELIQSKLIEAGVNPSRISAMAGREPTTVRQDTPQQIRDNQNIQITFKRE